MEEVLKLGFLKEQILIANSQVNSIKYIGLSNIHMVSYSRILKDLLGLQTDDLRA